MFTEPWRQLCRGSDRWLSTGFLGQRSGLWLWSEHQAFQPLMPRCPLSCVGNKKVRPAQMTAVTWTGQHQCAHGLTPVPPAKVWEGVHVGPVRARDSA